MLGDDDVAAGIPAEDQRGGADCVFPAVGEADQPPAVAAAGRRSARGAGGAHHSAKAAAIDELGAGPARRWIDDQEFVAADLDLVAVQHRGRLGAQPDPVDQRLGVREARRIAAAPCVEPLHNRMPRPDAFGPLERHGTSPDPSR